MNTENFKIVENNHPETTRCAYCDAQKYCNGGFNFKCQCRPNHHYREIKNLRKEKLEKIKIL